MTFILGRQQGRDETAQAAEARLRELMARSQALEAAIGDLPLLYREPLVLRHTAGLSVEQTAEVLGTTAGVVKTRLFRARARLQEALGKEWLTQ